MRPLQFRPILAASKPRDYTDQQFYDRLVFPVIATPKLDGIRCVTRDLPRPPDWSCEPMTRSLKPIPNEWVRYQIGKRCPPGLDGELITYDRDLLVAETPRPFNLVSSDIMTHGGRPEFKYHVFDYDIEGGRPYDDRLESLMQSKALPDFCKFVQHVWIKSLSHLLEYEEQQVALGYEGICFRDPNSKYKYGRSTLREGHLIKMKRFVTEEAVIIGSYEEMHNDNPITLGDTGYAERSSHKANLSGKNTLGGFKCVLMNDAKKPITDEITFNVGSGFTAEQRADYWKIRNLLVDKIITIKHQPHGAVEKPRIPIFIGFRELSDL